MMNKQHTPLMLWLILLVLACAAPSFGEQGDLAPQLPGTWRGAHCATGREIVGKLTFDDTSTMNLRVDFATFNHAITVQQKDGALVAYDLAWFALTSREVGEAVKGTLAKDEATTNAYQGGGGIFKKIVAGSLGMCLQQTHAVTLKGDLVTFKGSAVRSLYNAKGYSPDTFYGRFIPPGLIVGTAYAEGKPVGFFQLWKDGAAVERLPMMEKGVVHTITCLDNKKYHYTCYVPKAYAGGRPAPVLFFDNPGGGAEPLSTKMADELGWVMVGLTEARNGPYPESCENRDAALFDLRRRLNVDMSRLYFSGVSGGARRSTLAAATYPDHCAGVICFVASVNLVNAPLRVPIYFVTGQGDFNRKEVEGFYESEKKRGRKTAIVVHGGGHDPGGVENIENAIRWLSRQSK